jgi:ABC-2 type transport system permease protein
MAVSAQDLGLDERRFDEPRLRELRRTFITAARIGWRMEANWTDPILFFIYSVAKPVSAALILVVMLQVVAASSAAALRPFVILGTAFWSLVTSGITGLAWTILDDRERYRMLKYVYVSPADFIVVLLGRGVARLGVGIAATLITIAIGILALGLRIDLGVIDWPVLVLGMVGGILAIIALGMFMAAICLQTRQESWSYPDAFAGALFLVSGAVFPLAVLPSAVQALGLLTPVGWWIEAVRRAIDPSTPSALGGPGTVLGGLLGRPPTGIESLIGLFATGAVVTLAAAVVFRFSDRRARTRGLLDVTTGS